MSKAASTTCEISDGYTVLKLLLCLDISYDKASKLSRTIDLDVDIGADAVDYKSAAF